MTGVFAEMDMPDESEITALEELAECLKPLEGLMKRLCTEHFTALQADSVFNTAFDALRHQQTAVSDKILRALKTRYEQRKNTVLLSALSFLSDPMDYETCNKGLLELAELRVEMKALCTRLFQSRTRRRSLAVLRSPGPALLQTIQDRARALLETLLRTLLRSPCR